MSLVLIIFLYGLSSASYLKHPGQRIAEYLDSTRSKILNRSSFLPVSALYILNNGGMPLQKVLNNSANDGFNVVFLSFYTSGGPVGACAAWSSLAPDVQKAEVEAAHTKGVVIMVAVGGSTETPYAGDASAYGTQAAIWAQNNHLDGLDFDLENLNVGFTYGTLQATHIVNWFVNATLAARHVLKNAPCGGLISLAPQVSIHLAHDMLVLGKLSPISTPHAF